MTGTRTRHRGRDRRLETTDRSRLAEAVENTLKKSEGLVLVADEAGETSPPTRRSLPARSAASRSRNSSRGCSRSTARSGPAGVPRPRGEDGVRRRPHHPRQGPVHRGRCSGAVPEPDGRFSGPGTSQRWQSTSAFLPLPR